MRYEISTDTGALGALCRRVEIANTFSDSVKCDNTRIHAPQYIIQ